MWRQQNKNAYTQKCLDCRGSVPFLEYLLMNRGRGRFQTCPYSSAVNRAISSCHVPSSFLPDYRFVQQLNWLNVLNDLNRLRLFISSYVAAQKILRFPILSRAMYP